MKKLGRKILLVGVFGLLLIQSYATRSSVLTCDAYFTYEDYQGPDPVTGGITFLNASTGTYTNGSWDFGDGNFTAATADPITPDILLAIAY